MPTIRTATIAALAPLVFGIISCGRAAEKAGAPNGDILANSLVRSGQEPASAPPAQHGAAAEASSAEAWLGHWNGPEGTYLKVAQVADGLPHLGLTLKDSLDTPAKAYAGSLAGDAIHFRRGQEDLTIRRGTGADTGFKWLLDKRDCLIVVAGKEGYCRD